MELGLDAVNGRHIDALHVPQNVPVSLTEPISFAPSCETALT